MVYVGHHHRVSETESSTRALVQRDASCAERACSIIYVPGGPSAIACLGQWGMLQCSTNHQLCKIHAARRRTVVPRHLSDRAASVSAGNVERHVPGVNRTDGSATRDIWTRVYWNQDRHGTGHTCPMEPGPSRDRTDMSIGTRTVTGQDTRC